MVSNPQLGAASGPRVDLYSDTITRPTAAMRKAIAEAVVGNEQAGEDPTVNRLCDLVKDLTGKEAAVFLPSGTMCNQIAYRVWCPHGSEVLLDKTSHALHFEVGGMAANAGCMVRTVDGERGIFTAQQAEPLIRPGHGRHTQRTALVSVENTANMGGGTVWPLDQLKGLRAMATAHGLPIHMDGARLMNAVVASGVSAAAYAGEVDSVWIDLTKGLGCPIGAVLAGSAEFIERAWSYKHQYGGAMRQAGIVAAAGIHAFENHVDRLAEDHENARFFAQGISGIGGIRVDANAIETNMVFFDVSGVGIDATTFSQRLLGGYGVRIGAMGPTLLRAVTHLDVDRDGVEDAVAAVAAVAKSG